MALTPGTQIGPYEIQSPAGAGGMGEVYRAVDTRLGRTVAIKLLPESLSRDPDRLRRFEQEARAVAALEHPNILGLHDVGSHQDAPYLVSEFLEGESLRERLEAGPLPQRKISDYGLQIARGLAAAHEKNIVHRDLKPENIFITRDGRVKLLDFGLAKLASAQAAAAAPDGVTALTHETATSPGVIMGTVGYMSPEQVRGSVVDHRSDIFSFGTVLYEMASGARAFKGESGVETMTAILKQDPPEFAPERAVPPGLERVIRRCLEKSPDQRFQSASDLAFAIEALSGTTSTSREMALAPARSRSMVLAGAAVALLVLGALLSLLATRAMRTRPAAMHFSIIPSTESGAMALSPDGSMLAYVGTEASSGRTQLYLQEVGGRVPRAVNDSQGATYPFWSAAGDALAFFARGKLFKVPVVGGTPQAIADVTSARGGAWNQQGVILYAPDAATSLWRINADGSGKAQVTKLEAGVASHRWPVFLPDGQRFLFYAGNFDYGINDSRSGVYASSLSGGEVRQIISSRANAGFAEPGYLFFLSGDKLVAAKFDPETLTLEPEQKVVADRVGFQPQIFWAAFSVSRSGHLVYNREISSTFSRLTWYDRSGRIVGELGDLSTQANPALSPDGSALALDVTDLATSNTDIWIYRLASGTAHRFSFGADEEASPAWAPDSSRLIYRSSATSALLQMRPVSGAEQARVVTDNTDIIQGLDILPTSWTPDGREVICSGFQPTGADIFVLDVASKRLKPLLAGRANETHPQLSSDGKWLAYVSDESSQAEVYVTAYPGATAKWQISRGGGTEPRWNGNGKELFFVAPDGTLHSVAVDAGRGNFSAGTAMPLFRILARAPVSSTDLYNYTVTPDGRRFLVNRYIRPPSLPPLEIILNATAELEK